MSKAITIISGTGVPVYGNDVDTDRIVPARFLKEITFDHMGEYFFYDVRFDEQNQRLDHPLNDDRFSKATIMVVGRNFGCGSSREHAAQAVKRFGIDAVIGESFGEIFAGNCQSLGVPAVCLPAEQIAQLWELIESNPNVSLVLDLEKNVIVVGETSWPIQVAESRRQAFLQGSWDALGLLRDNMELVHETAAKLPYFSFK